MSMCALAAAQGVDLKYSFDPTAPSGYTKVAATDVYTPEKGYGFDLESKVKTVASGNGGYTTRDNSKGFFFSAKLPEGAYEVTVTLGDPSGDSTTTVKSETRRLMLESLHTSGGKLETKSFLVHVRRPEYPGGSVAFKDREKLPILYVTWDDSKLIPFTELDWDEKLTLAFTGEKPALVSLRIATAPPHTTVYLVGDSTMTDQMMEPFAAWGQMFPRFFKEPVLIANYAECGESAASFISERRWPKLMSEIHAGDFVLVQFGINDIGLAEQRIRDLFGQYISDTKAKGATPVLVTSQNLERRQIGNYAEVMRKIAAEQNVPLIDLNAMSVKLFAAMGAETTHKAFIDGTHHSAYGAYELAKCVVQGAIDAKLPFAEHVVDDWKTFDPSKPDDIASFKMPEDPQLDPARPGGPGTPDHRGPMAGAVQNQARRGGAASRPATQNSSR
jgi:lysophospholipase L1-like esterase